MKKVLLLILLASSLFSESIRLYNDSPWKLRAAIRGADGTYLGEMIVLPEHFVTWSNAYPSFGPGGQQYQPNPNRTMTPFVVQWSCLDGDVFGVCTNIPTGGAAIAESCNGPKYCKPPKKKNGKKSPYGPSEDDEQLYQNQERNLDGTLDQNQQRNLDGTSPP